MFFFSHFHRRCFFFVGFFLWCVLLFVFVNCSFFWLVVASQVYRRRYSSSLAFLFINFSSASPRPSRPPPSQVYIASSFTLFSTSERRQYWNKQKKKRRRKRLYHLVRCINGGTCTSVCGRMRIFLNIYYKMVQTKGADGRWFRVIFEKAGKENENSPIIFSIHFGYAEAIRIWWKLPFIHWNSFNRVTNSYKTHTTFSDANSDWLIGIKKNKKGRKKESITF